jgi:hypothetical protein
MEMSAELEVVVEALEMTARQEHDGLVVTLVAERAVEGVPLPWRFGLYPQPSDAVVSLVTAAKPVFGIAYRVEVSVDTLERDQRVVVPARVTGNTVTLVVVQGPVICTKTVPLAHSA